MVIWVICPASMSKSSVRQRDLSHPAFGPVTCSYAKRWREVNTTWEYLIWKCNSGCNKSYIKSIYFTSTAQKFKLFGVCYLDLQNYLKLIPPRRFFFPKIIENLWWRICSESLKCMFILSQVLVKRTFLPG